MSVGPAALGNVLVQRLDAVLGTTMSAANANQISGARPDAVSQPGNLDKPGSADGSNRDSRQDVQTGGSRGDRPTTVIDAKTAAALALAARGLITRSDTTASAPTTLGATARTILALLAQYPDTPAAVQGRAPLWTANAPAAQPSAGTPAQSAASQPAIGQPAATQSAPLPSPQPAATQAAAAPAAQAVPLPAAAKPLPASAASATAIATPAAPPAAAAAPASSPNAAQPEHSAGPKSTAPVGAKDVNAAAHVARTAPAPSAHALGQALRSALQTSGLFYESHLADMVFGRSHPAQLQQEPQTRLTRDNASAEGARLHAETPASASRPGGDVPAAPNTSGASAPAPLSGIHQDLSLLVRQQLDVLANQALTWQGEAWPGAPMEWEVERDPYGGEPDAASPTWATRLKLDLPRLGLVDARLNLAGDQIVLQLIAPHSATELNQSSDLLRSRLLAAGLTLSHLTVNVVDPRPVMPADL